MIAIAWELVAAGFLAAALAGIVDCALSGASVADWVEHDYDDEVAS